MTARRSETTGLEVAIIGMSCHFPGASSIEAFLGNLRGGVESIRFFSEQELEAAGAEPTLRRNAAFVPAGGVLDDIESFDAAYFGYMPREAELIDPQQRLFLERAAEALERAGYDPERFAGSIGVYAGLTNSSYAALLSKSAGLRGVVDGFQVLVANDRDFLAARVAYKLNLQGPAVVVQTACSTSLAAVHIACQGLLAGDCDMALAGGVSVRVPHRTGYLYQEEGIASPDGHCRPFDAQAKGTVPGNGVGLVVLRRLSDALAAGDAIDAVIKGSAINNDGANRLGFTAPRIEGQARVIRAALAAAEVEPASIGYVEAHGTATALGDPIEISALNQAFAGAGLSRCAIGSVKSNFGHLDAAAGVAGLTKAVLSLKHRQLFPSLHFERPNPKADFAGGPFYVNTALAEWRTDGRPRRAGVSSFGMGGTNVHVVLEAAPEPARAVAVAGPQVLLLSARTEPALAQASADLAAHLRGHPELDLVDVAFTLAVGRRQLAQRAALAVASIGDAARVLEGGEPGRLWTGRAKDTAPPLAFLFTGQAAQQVGMTRGLYAAAPVFRRELDACCDQLRSPMKLDLREVLYPPPEGSAAAAEALRSTALAQPALFAVEYALARLWMSWGVKPQAMIGHSIGEYVAAHLAGVLSLEDALALVAERGRLMASCAPGAMLAVLQPVERLLPRLAESVSLAAVNAPDVCVISGPLLAIEEWEERLRGEGISCSRLHTSRAFHSAAMEPALAPFRAQLARVALRPPSVPFVSNLTGTWITTNQATDPDYWVSHLRAPVQFAAGVAELLREPDRVLLEVGPGDTLASLARRQLKPEFAHRVVASLRGRPSGEDEAQALLEAAAQLWVAGVCLDWSTRFAESQARRVQLPTYPFERRRYWIDPPKRAQGPTRAAASARRQRVADSYYVPTWRRKPGVATGASEDASRFCLFMDRRGLGAALAERLRASGADVVEVEAGAAFERRGPSAFAIDASAASHFQRLLEALALERRVPQRLVHLWGVDDAGQEPAGHLPSEISVGFFSVMNLVQAVGTLDRPELRLDLVTTGMQDVTGGESLRPLKAVVLGASRVIPMEFASIACRSIDLDSAELGGGVAQHDAALIERLRAELLVDEGEPVVALRGPYRWVPGFEQVPLPERARPAISLREKGVYLITGGLGGIGLALAEYLARTHKARLVLVSRSGLGERFMGTGVTGGGANERMAARIRAVERLEAEGAEVFVGRADVASREEMAGILSEAERRFGPIQGVVHAAGVAGAGLMQLRGRPQAEAVLAPKIAGTLVLQELLRGRPLDFMVLCSSLTGVLGAVGQADYAAANAFLDAFAEHAAHSPGAPRTISIAWDTWKDVGMALDTELPRELAERRAELLSLGLTSAEGVEAFCRALDAGLPRVLVSTVPLEERLRGRSRPEPAGTPDGMEPARLLRHPRPSLQNEHVAPRTDLERTLVEAFQTLLGIEPVGMTDNFFELGGESLSALRLVSLLKESHALSLSLTRLYESPTIELLARHLEGGFAGPSPLSASERRGEARAEILAQRRQGRRR